MLLKSFVWRKIHSFELSMGKITQRTHAKKEVLQQGMGNTPYQKNGVLHIHKHDKAVKAEST